MVNFTGNTCIWIYFMDVNGCKWYISEEKHHRWWLRKCSVSCYLSHKADGQVMENHWFKVTSATGYFNDGSSLKPPNYRLFFQIFPNDSPLFSRWRQIIFPEGLSSLWQSYPGKKKSVLQLEDLGTSKTNGGMFHSEVIIREYNGGMFFSRFNATNSKF